MSTRHVFKVLAFHTDDTVRETVVSSFFNYFIDPQGDHGFGSSLLSGLLGELQTVVPEISKEVATSVKAINKTSDATVTVTSEWFGSQTITTMQRLSRQFLFHIDGILENALRYPSSLACRDYTHFFL